MGKKLLDAKVYQLSRDLMRDLDTPRSLAIDILMVAGEWDQIAAMTINPLHYLDTSVTAEKFKRDAQATHLLRKFQGLPLTTNKEDVARDGFWHAERQCKQTNDRLDPFLFNTVYDCDGDVQIHNFVNEVRQEIALVLGQIPQEICPKFGPGATFESKRHVRSKLYTVCDKLSTCTTVTPSAKVLFDHYYHNSAWERGLLDGGYYIESEYGASLERGNRLAFVPKDATKDRTIGIEPGGNVWLQLGVGAVMRQRLQKSWSLLLDKGASERYHQQLARESSVSAEYCTIDLSSASDTVSKKLVKLLLPETWYDLLDSLRSPMTLVRGRGKRAKARWVLLEKFSSMGNGFTFELETLIFAAITKIAVRRRHPSALGEALSNLVSVYGDDIIVANDCYDDVVGALQYFGFSTNVRKSFSTSAFRESCGGDFFYGREVRPYFLEEVPNEASHWITIANGLNRCWDYQSHHRFCPVFRAHKTALGQLPLAIRRCKGPAILGDVLIHTPAREWNCRVKWQQRYFKVWRPVVTPLALQRWGPGVQLAAALLGVRSSGPVPRNTVDGFKFGYIRYS